MKANLNVAIIPGPGFDDLEYWAVAMRMQEAGATVTTLGLAAGDIYESKTGGLTAVVDHAASEVKAGDFDAIIVPGGWGPDKVRRDPAVLQLIRDADAAGILLGFICHGGWVAASAGILKGRKFTGSRGVKDDLENAGATWVDEPAFREGNIVWGRVVADIPHFNRELAKALVER